MNYGQIRTQFKAILNRTDCSDALADTFISQGLLRSQRFLRIPANEEQATEVVAGGFTAFTLPTDLMEIISVVVDDRVVQFLPVRAWTDVPIATNGVPEYFTRIGTALKFKPTPSTGAQIVVDYYGSFEPFTSDTTTTKLSTVASDVVVYGGLSYASDYFLDERKGMFEERYLGIIADLQSQAYDNDGPAQVGAAYALEGY
jgi:hypothetical protein